MLHLRRHSIGCSYLQFSILDLRNPTRSDGFNLLNLINKYMDKFKENPDDITSKAKAEKYAKILAKTLIITSLPICACVRQRSYLLRIKRS